MQMINRRHQSILIVSTILASCFGMQAVHESGHVVGAWITGGQVTKVVLHPLTISRTDLAINPRPLFVVWAGPIFGIILPVMLWGIAVLLRIPGAYVFRFFAGFCLLANGLYIGVGSFDRIGDCGVMLRHGSSPWHLWLYGVFTAPFGLWLWHNQGEHFGLGPKKSPIDPRIAYATLTTLAILLTLGIMVGA